MTHGLTTATVLAALAVLAAGCTATPSAEAPDGDAGPVAVEIARVDRQAWPTFVEAGGVLRARTSAVLSSRLLAPVLAVHVRAGDAVRQGQPLIELDAAAARTEAVRAAAALAAAGRSAEAAEADRTAAEAAAALARTTHDRIRQLHDTRSATPQELDEAAGARASADARAAAARAAAASARSALEAAQAAADGGAIVAGYAVIRAPFDGIVARRDVDPGSMATPGLPLLVVDQAGALQLDVDLDASRAAGIGPGHAASVRIDGAGDTAPWIDGRVTEVARLDTTSPSFRIRIEVPARPGDRAGLFGRARLPAAPRDALTVPAGAVVRRGQLTLVFVASAEGLARLRTVRAGESADGRMEILAGVDEGERVIVSPPESLTDGARVTVSPATAPGGRS
jgi:RND family efflux transporter MFP subunit